MGITKTHTSLDVCEGCGRSGVPTRSASSGTNTFTSCLRMVEGQIAQVLDVAEGVTEVAMRLVMLPPGVRTHPAVTWHLLSHLPSAESVRVLRPEATTCHRRWAMWPRPRGACRVSGQGLWPSGTHALSGAGQPVAAAGEVLHLVGEPAPRWDHRRRWWHAMRCCQRNHDIPTGNARHGTSRMPNDGYARPISRSKKRSYGEHPHANWSTSRWR